MGPGAMSCRSTERAQVQSRAVRGRAAGGFPGGPPELWLPSAGWRTSLFSLGQGDEIEGDHHCRRHGFICTHTGVPANPCRRLASASLTSCLSLRTSVPSPGKRLQSDGTRGLLCTAKDVIGDEHSAWAMHVARGWETSHAHSLRSCVTHPRL